MVNKKVLVTKENYYLLSVHFRIIYVIRNKFDFFKQGVKRPKTLKIRTKSLHTGGELTVVVHTNLPYYRGALNYTHPYFLPCDMTRK